MMFLVAIVGSIVSASAADTGLEIDISGGASPGGYSDALSMALRLEAESRGLKAVEYNGSARGTPMLGVKASATVTVTCADDSKHESSVSDVTIPVGRDSNNWQGVGKQVADRLLRDLECVAPSTTTDPPPKAELSTRPADERITGSASPDSYTTALMGAFGRALDGRAEVTGLEFHGSAKGTPVVGISADVSADVVCGGATHELAVEDVSEPVGDGGSWATFADKVVERVLRDLSCE